MLNEEAMEGFRSKRSSYIPDQTWHRENRVEMIVSCLKNKEPAWALHNCLMELADGYGYLIINIESLSEVSDLSGQAIQRALMRLDEMNLWVRFYDKKTKLTEMQVNPAISQKFNDAAKELQAVMNWERIANKDMKKRKNYEFSVANAEQYARFRDTLGSIKAPPIEENNMLINLIMEKFDQYEQRSQRLEEMLQKLVNKVEGKTEDTAIVEEVKSHLSIVK